MRSSAHRLIAIVAGAFSAIASAAEPEWPQFLGPDRNGVSAEIGLADAWPEGGPKQVWRVPGGVGKSGIAVSRGKALTLVHGQGKQQLVALNAQTGETLWRTPLAPEYRNAMGDGPRATPTINGDRVYVFTGEGILASVNFADGKVLWSKNVVEELGGKVNDYGMACSPLVAAGQIIVTPGTPKAAVAAYDAAGKHLWSAGSGPAGYSSPAVLTAGGQQQIVAFGGDAARGIALTTGDLLWEYPYETDFGCNIATPIAIAGQVFISSGENHGCALLALQRAGSKFEVTETWESQGAQSVLRNEWQTSILHEGHLYGLDNVGGAGPVTHLTCVEAATGKRVWQKPRFGKGNLILAEGKLFFSMMSGELILVRATPKAYEELARATLTGPTRQAPSLAGGLLYLRDDKEIVCVDVRKP